MPMGIKKRKRGDEGVEEEGSGRKKKAKREQDVFGRFLSLVEEDTLAGGGTRESIPIACISK